MVLIITMIILSVLTAALLPTLFTTEMGQVSASGAMRAYYLAEAGGRYTLPRLAGISPGTHTFKFSGGNTFFRIEKLSNTRFTSTGVISEGTGLESKVVITYRLRVPFDYGLFGGDGVAIGNNNLVDSYSSAGQPTSGENGAVGTNGDTITVGINTDIHGEQEVSAGKGMTPEALPPGVASWTNKTAELIMFFPGQTVNLGPGEYYTLAVNISNNSTLNITGDVVIYVMGPTIAWNNSTLNIASGGSLTVYAGGSVNLSHSSLVAPDQVPANFIIYGLAWCQTVALSGVSTTYAAVYAPAADITVGNNDVVYGSLVGETVTVGNNAQVHYDEDLQNIGADSADVEQYFTGE